MYPNLLTVVMSATIISPHLPPRIFAVRLEFCRDITASPERKEAYLSFQVCLERTKEGELEAGTAQLTGQKARYGHHH